MKSKFKPITGHQISLLKKSFRQLNPHVVADRFYTKLFEKHPEVKKLFPPDIPELGTKLMSVFELVVFSFQEKSHDQFLLQDEVLMPLRQLGRKHDDKGIERKHYAIANALLLETMHETGKEFFTEEVSQAWKLALENLTEAMLNTDVKPSAQTEKDSGISFRDTFSYIKKRLLNQPD